MIAIIAVLLLLPAVALAAPVPKANDATRLLVVTADGKATLHTFDGREAKVLVETPKEDTLISASLSPDGKRVAYAVRLRGMDADTAVRLRGIADDKPADLAIIRGEGKGQLLPRVRVHSLFWSPDGKAVAGCLHDRFAERAAKKNRPYLSTGYTNFRIDTANGERTDLHAVTEYRAIAFTPDGKSLVCTRAFDKPLVDNRQVIGYETVLTPADKIDPRVVLADPLDLVPLAQFPDGRRWAVSKLEDGREWKLGVYTAGEKQPVWWDAEVKDTPIPVAVRPDGRRVVFALNPGWQKDQKGKPAVVWAADADGKNAVKLWESESGVRSIDWR